MFFYSIVFRWFCKFFDVFVIFIIYFFFRILVIFLMFLFFWYFWLVYYQLFYFAVYRCVVIIVFPENRKYRCVVRIGFQKMRFPLSNLFRKKIITITTTPPWCTGGVGKARFEQPSTTHSGTGEKETLNMNVVGKKNQQKTKI